MDKKDSVEPGASLLYKVNSGDFLYEDEETAMTKNEFDEITFEEALDGASFLGEKVLGKYKRSESE